MYRIYREKDGEKITVATAETVEDAVYTLEEAKEHWGAEWALHMVREKKSKTIKEEK